MNLTAAVNIERLYIFGYYEKSFSLFEKWSTLGIKFYCWWNFNPWLWNIGWWKIPLTFVAITGSLSDDFLRGQNIFKWRNNMVEFERCLFEKCVGFTMGCTYGYWNSTPFGVGWNIFFGMAQKVKKPERGLICITTGTTRRTKRGMAQNEKPRMGFNLRNYGYNPWKQKRVMSQIEKPRTGFNLRNHGCNPWNKTWKRKHVFTNIHFPNSQND